MRKLIFCLTVFLFSIITFTSVSSAAQSITETPDVKIVIEGKNVIYNDVTINVEGRIMLPLREVLTNLGVKNDYEHIIWDNAKKSVTVKKDDKVIYLEAGNTIATVNGEEFTVDVPPIIYPKNNRTYIPARFVAESLGKAVVWDAETRSVLISDKESYSQIKDILDKSTKAMKDAKKFKFGMKNENKYLVNNSETEFNVGLIGEIDLENKALHAISSVKIFGMEFIDEFSLIDGCDYKYDEENGWSKEELSQSQLEEYNKFFEVFSKLVAFNEKDIEKMSAGLEIIKSDNTNEIVIKGDALAFEYMITIAKFLISGMRGIDELSYTDVRTNEVDMYGLYMELTLDKNKYYVKEIVMSMDCLAQEGFVREQSNFKVSVYFEDFNGDFDIIAP
ncbi:copper amine oxidase N-terminal domain-containing protein [Acetivibrio clariflavus]|uniref:Copper amine oxidase family protein n=1 Tax=Acetivibrio clariflavus (strain DSM 19732 / NBRC 101661 / EBR45) TaxID=720554 RepID=G8M1F2_ACECE|nr:copper amine oxidase N-terminal domain-containing protein [Acetivibrio clariflavus]AEV69167.1 copper amine oxidase family protein [Acetivibrio clariflavus DSM 19732]